jgi:hypothetical protein
MLIGRFFIAFKQHEFMFEQGSGNQGLYADFSDAAILSVPRGQEVGNVLELSADSREVSGHCCVFILTKRVSHYDFAPSYSVESAAGKS